MILLYNRLLYKRFLLYIHRNLTALFQLLEVSAKMKAAGIKVTNVGTGSTPCCSHSGATAMKQLTEIHPGNYVFYDTQQMAVGTRPDAQ